MVAMTSLDYHSFFFRILGLDIGTSNDFYCSTNDMMSYIEVSIFGYVFYLMKPSALWSFELNFLHLWVIIH